MGSIKNFEDLNASRAARKLAGYIYDMTRRAEFSRDYGLCNQIREAAGSVMHNSAEGFEAGTDPEFARFLRMARRSVGEVQSEFYLAHDAGYVGDEELKQAYTLAVDAKKLTNGMLGYLRGRT